MIDTVGLPVCMILHPVGDGPTRAMNVLSTKLWIRALVDLVPNVSFCAAWLPYAEAMIDRERGLRDAFALLERMDAAVAVGGDFTRGMRSEWDRAAKLGLARVDLTRSPMPGLLTYETFADARASAFHAAVADAFRGVKAKVAA